MKRIKPALSLITALITTVLLGGCSVFETYQAEQNLSNKIKFDLKRLDQDGLYGVSDGKRALSYEFCIPGTLDAAQQIMDIDPSAIIYKDSGGRVGCTDKQYLAMGDTFQKDYRVTLQQLVNLDYVSSIVEVYFE